MIDFTSRLQRSSINITEIENKKKLIEKNKDFLNGKILLEFGVCNGDSLNEFATLYKENNIPTMFYGFDSFLGLPEEKEDINNPSYWPKGKYYQPDIEIPKSKVPPSTVFINGWFEDTLNDETLSLIKDKQIGVVHIDCDIYTSTIQVLEWLVQNELLIDGTLIVYDDWGGHIEKNVSEFECGEGRAHKEICEKYNLNFEFISCDPIKPHHEICTFRYRGKNL